MRTDFIFLIYFQVVVTSCVNNSCDQNIVQENQKIGLWKLSIDSLGIDIEQYYGYDRHGKSYITRERYFTGDELFLDVSYQFSSIKNLEIYNDSLKDLVMPFIENRLGFDLFHTNCGGCHNAFPDEKSRPFINRLVLMKKEGRLKWFLSERQVLNNDLSISHPNFDYLDTNEINSIIRYLDFQTGKVVPAGQ